MTLWLIFAVMTAAAIFAVTWPLVRHGKTGRSGSDVAVYRDQLDEIERDLAAGAIEETEAQAARVEVSRRLIAASDAAHTESEAEVAATVAWYRPTVAVVSILMLTVGAGGLYLRLGSPGFATETSASQSSAAAGRQTSIENLVAKVEEHLRANPRDGRGWEVLAPVYMQVGRYSDSVTAWRNTLALLGETADRQANLGEALVAEANGDVTAEAKSAFERAFALDKTSVTARYYLGTAAEQDGKRDEAAKIWRELIAQAPPGAPWVSDVRTALSRVEGKPAASPPGPSASQVAAAAQQPPDQQNAMIRGMVDRLAARLKQDGSDPDAWARLVRSYRVLGEPDKAQATIADARRALANDPDKLKRLDVALKEIDNGAAPAAANPPAQSAAAPEAVPQQHDADTIQSMVNRLAERVKKSGGDPEGWIMLTRSYLTLGEKDKAASAIKDARAALASDADKLQLFNDALRRFKIDDTAGVASATPVAPATPPETAAAGDQNAMIRGMVARLADRLKQDGSDIDGWLRLVRSYVVLGERDKALQAVADARQAIGNDAEKRRRLDDFAKSLGLEG
jgi:cytochrome c-type biogenesis protein CcmH